MLVQIYLKAVLACIDWQEITMYIGCGRGGLTCNTDVCDNERIRNFPTISEPLPCIFRLHWYMALSVVAAVSQKWLYIMHS